MSLDPTIAVFDKNARLYQQKYMDQSRYANGLDRCIQLAPQRGSLLDLGCGPGNVSLYLSEKLSDWTFSAVDLSPAMVELAKINLPMADCRVDDVRNLHHFEGPYELIVVGFCIPYLSREEVEAMIKKTYDRLTEGGVLYLSFMEGDYSRSGYQVSSNGEDRAMTYYYMAGEVEVMLKAVGFAVDTVLHSDFVKANDSIDIDVQLIAVKNEMTNYVRPL